ncbi:MAG: hypothetical protein OEZ68_22005 [Gammaproteobacteria bacterium]|nr:hypothetical protein [Gammaproteobacteria bacterium]MDH5803465.1 hypothetical protein [Gammaproteobacteria bacterium]
MIPLFPNQILENRAKEEFLDWCKQIPSPPYYDSQIVLSEFLKGKTTSNDPFSEFVLEVSNNYYDQITLNVKIGRGEYVLSECQTSKSRPMKQLAISCGINTKLKLENMYIEHMHINLTDLHLVMEITGCKIGEINILTSNDGRKFSSKISNTFIGKLVLNPDVINNFKIHSGFVGNMECPPPGSNNPFSGSIKFSNNTDFPTKPIDGFIQGAQPYKNIQHHLRALDNNLAADIFHSLEMRMERHYDSRWSNVFNWFYGAISNYGASIGRPILWLVGLFLLTSVAIYGIDGTEKAASDDQYHGWQRKLIDPDKNDARMAKAFYLTASYTVNPLGVFKTKNLVVPKDYLALAISTVYSVFSSASFTLLILAIRRRFKLK